MARRSIPVIDPSDLRDHADDARVARVWERIDRDLSGAPVPASRAMGGFALALVAATVAAFGGGIFVGRSFWNDAPGAPLTAVASADRPMIDVFAAGSERRTFPLPGGGQIRLEPGATVEVERAAGALTLRLVQGEASVDTLGAGSAERLAIVADEARLSAQGGSALVVRRTGEMMDVSVTDGSVNVESPAGPQQLGRGQASAFPLRTRAAALPTSVAVRSAPVALPGVVREPLEIPASIAAEPDWRMRYNAGDLMGAYELLKQQPGGVGGAIDSAGSAAELMLISDVTRKGGNHGAAARALAQVVDRFPEDGYAQVAAFTAAELYEKNGQSDLATRYRERVQSQDGALAEDALCKLIRAERRAGHKEEASRMAQEYVSKYENGRCRDEAEQTLRGDEIAADGNDGPPANEGDGGAP